MVKSNYVVTDASNHVTQIFSGLDTPPSIPVNFTATAIDDITYSGLVLGDLIWQNGTAVDSPTHAAQKTVDTTTSDLLTKARAGITANNTFLALSSPTQAQTLAQVQRLTRENTAIIKLLAGLVLGATDLLSDETGT